MDLNETCVVTLNKGTKKVKCCKLFIKEINRELGVHEDVEIKGKTSISDTITGFRLTGINKNVKDVKEADVRDVLETFIKHYTVEGIREEFKRIEDELAKEQA